MLLFYLDLRCFAKNSKLAEARWSGVSSSVCTNTDSALSNWQQSVVIWCYKISQIKKTREIALCHIIKRRFNEKTRHKKVGYKVFYFVCDTAVRCARSFSDRTQCFNLASGLQPVLKSPVSTSDNFDIVVFEAKFQKKWMAKSDFDRTDPILCNFQLLFMWQKILINNWKIHNIGSVLAKSILTVQFI